MNLQWWSWVILWNLLNDKLWSGTLFGRISFVTYMYKRNDVRLNKQCRKSALGIIVNQNVHTTHSMQI